MNANRVKLELFDSEYQKIKGSLKKEDFTGAKKHVILAAKCMYELARESTGEDRRYKLMRADQLYNYIADIDKIIADKKSAKRRSGAGGAGQRNTRPEDSILNGSTSTGGSRGDENKPFFHELPTPETSFDDVAGLEDVKDAVREKVIEPLLHPELYEKYRIKKGGGIIMYGPPGTGKTMIAEAVAHEVNASFYSLRCSELLDSYFGGTEHNIGALFDQARSKGRAVIFFDEFESLAVGRDKNRSTVMRRIVTELLTQMQGINRNGGKDDSMLLVIAATNMPWMMDSAFMRPGRFDERIYVGLPDAEARGSIIKMNLKGIPLNSKIDYDYLVDKTDGFNGSDIAHLVGKAKNLALKREKSGGVGGVTMEDFEEALKVCHSSVMKSDIEKLMAWRNENG